MTRSRGTSQTKTRRHTRRRPSKKRTQRQRRKTVSKGRQRGPRRYRTTGGSFRPREGTISHRHPLARSLAGGDDDGEPEKSARAAEQRLNIGNPQSRTPFPSAASSSTPAVFRNSQSENAANAAEQRFQDGKTDHVREEPHPGKKESDGVVRKSQSEKAANAAIDRLHTREWEKKMSDSNEKLVREKYKARDKYKPGGTPIHLHGVSPSFGTNPSDREIALHAVSYPSPNYDGQLRYLAALQDDKEIVKAAVLANPRNLEYASETLKGDEEIVMAAVAQEGYGHMIDHASPLVKTNDEVVKAAVQSSGWDVLRYVSEIMKNPKFVEEMLQIDGRAIMHAPDLWSNTEFMTKAVSYHGLAYTLMPTPTWDHDLALQALKTEPKAFEWMLQVEKPFAIQAMDANGLALEYASEEFKDDFEVVRAAVINNPLAFQYASKTQKANPELIELHKRRMLGPSKMLAMATAFKTTGNCPISTLSDDLMYVISNKHRAKVAEQEEAIENARIYQKRLKRAQELGRVGTFLEQEEKKSMDLEYRERIRREDAETAKRMAQIHTRYKAAVDKSESLPTAAEVQGQIASLKAKHAAADAAREGATHAAEDATPAAE